MRRAGRLVASRRARPGNSGQPHVGSVARDTAPTKLKAAAVGVLLTVGLKRTVPNSSRISLAAKLMRDEKLLKHTRDGAI